MAVRLWRPSQAALESLLARCRDDALTYAPTGATLGDGPAPHLARKHWDTRLRDGTFDDARAAHDGWKVHRLAGLEVVTDGPLAVGTNVAMSAPLPIGWVDVTCRVVAVIDEPNRYGFAYGTLPVHPECGEEAFVVSRSGEAVRFDITALSGHAATIARLAPPVARALQHAAVRRYLDAMPRAVG